MLNIRQISALQNTRQRIVDIVRSHPFYVFYGLGFDLQYRYNNYISFFGEPRYIIDRSKGGQTFRGVPVLSSLAHITERDYCVVISAPSFASEIVAECRKYVEEKDIVLYAGDLGETGRDYPAFLLENEDAICAFYCELADDESRRVLENWLIGRVSNDVKRFLSICTNNNYMNFFLDEECLRYAGYDSMFPMVTDRTAPNDAYFTTGLFEPKPDCVFYDIGAAYGDTVAGFFEYGSGGRVVAVEMDPRVAAQTEQFCREKGYAARVINCGVSDAEGSISVGSNNLGGTSLNMATDSASGQGRSVRITTIDTLARETGLEPDWIKMDVEGAELSVLHGAEQTIRKRCPTLSVCLYHKYEDIVEIPKYIRSINPAYQLYLRHFSIQTSELVLFAI